MQLRKVAREYSESKAIIILLEGSFVLLLKMIACVQVSNLFMSLLGWGVGGGE